MSNSLEALKLYADANAALLCEEDDSDSRNSNGLEELNKKASFLFDYIVIRQISPKVIKNKSTGFYFMASYVEALKKLFVCDKTEGTFFSTVCTRGEYEVLRKKFKSDSSLKVVENQDYFEVTYQSL